MKLIDRISLHRLITTLLDFILKVIDAFKKNKTDTPRKRRRIFNDK